MLLSILMLGACSIPKKNSTAIYLPYYDYFNHPEDTFTNFENRHTVEPEAYKIKFLNTKNKSISDKQTAVNQEVRTEVTKNRVRESEMNSKNFQLKEDTAITVQQSIVTDNKDKQVYNNHDYSFKASTLSSDQNEQMDTSWVSRDTIKLTLPKDITAGTQEAPLDSAIDTLSRKNRIKKNTINNSNSTHSNEAPIIQNAEYNPGIQLSRSSIKEDKNYARENTINTKQKNNPQKETAATFQRDNTASIQLLNLENQVNYLSKQNQNLQSTINDIRREIKANQTDNSRQENALLIASISHSLERALSGFSQSSQSLRTDTVIREIINRDTIVKKEIIESKKQVEKNEQLQDSLLQLQAYLALKNQALSSLQDKIRITPIPSSNKDTISITMYYAPSKIISINEKNKLNELLAKIENKKIEKVSLISFTDKSGSPTLNLRLSNQRAVRIVDKLTKTGIAREKIYLQYFGSQYASENVIESERKVQIIVEISK